MQKEATQVIAVHVRGATFPVPQLLPVSDKVGSSNPYPTLPYPTPSLLP